MPTPLEPSPRIAGRQVAAIMLAGTIQPSPLRQALDLPVLCLPMARIDGDRAARPRPVGTVLDTWLGVLSAVPEVSSVRIVLNSRAEMDVVNRQLAQLDRMRLTRGDIRTVAEPAAWRGAGGILRDVTGGLQEDAIVLVVEAHMLPPRDVRPMVEAMLGATAPPLHGMVGTLAGDQPAGVYAFTHASLEFVPQIGYHDLKEQFLPQLHKEQRRVMTVRLGDRGIRLRDRAGYLAAVQVSLGAGEGVVSRWEVADTAQVSASAVLDGFCVVGAGARIDDSAVVHDSVVLAGAHIGAGAVVSHSVIGPGAMVQARERLVREVRSVEAPPRRRRRLGFAPEPMPTMPAARESSHDHDGGASANT